jgi:hypothetical protein
MVSDISFFDVDNNAVKLSFFIMGLIDSILHRFFSIATGKAYKN